MINLIFKDLLKNIPHFIKNKLIIFTVSNAVVSLSNFIGPIILVYFFNDSLFSDFIYNYQIVLFLILAFEFGASTTYISKFKNYPKIVKSNQNFIESVLIIGLSIISILLYFFKKEVLATILLCPLGSVLYIYNKAKNLSDHKFNVIIKTSFVVLLLRIISLIVICVLELDNINYILLWYFVFPYLFEIIYSLKDKNRFDIINVDFKNLKNYLFFSISICLSGLVFNSLFRINLYFLEKYDYKDLISYIGFSLSLSGVIALINNSFKNFHISKLSSRNSEEVTNYIISLKKIRNLLYILPIILSIFYTIYLYFFNPFKELYKPLIIGIISIFYISSVIYFGLYNVLSKAFDFMKLELNINIVRLIIVSLLSYFLNLNYPIITYFIICFIIVIFEFFYVKFIKYKLSREYGIKV